MSGPRHPTDHTPPPVWTAYAERKPPGEGEYRWRVPSVRVKGLSVQFVGHMRERGAGYERAISPAFDYWDGYQLHVPAGTEWTTTEVKCKSHEYVGLSLPAIELLPCPFCKIVPFWEGRDCPRSGGIVVCAGPHEYNTWSLKCCSWAQTPRYPDPRELAEVRNRMLRGAAS